MNNYEKSMPITSWAEDDRPREKLMLKGRQALSDAELIAILIGSGTRKMSAVELSKYILDQFKKVDDCIRITRLVILALNQ